MMTRRQLLGSTSTGIGVAALASLLNPELSANPALDPMGRPINPKTGGLAELPHFKPKAKRVIYLHQSGAPSQIDLFDYKPKLKDVHGSELPDSVRKGQRITGMTSGQDSFPVASSVFDFQRHGQTGTFLSELLPHHAKIVDDISIIKTIHTDAINHDPAITFIQTGSQQPGRPSLGAWLSYGLGSETPGPACLRGVTRFAKGRAKNNAQPLFSRLWGSGLFCRRVIRESSFAPAATPCSISLTRPESTRKPAPPHARQLAKLNMLKAEAVQATPRSTPAYAVRDGL